MKMTKRILAFVLCFAMLLGMAPMFALRADAAENVLDAAIFCSDVHGSTSDLTSVLSGVKTSGVDYSSIGFVGDTCLTVANTTSTVQSALGDTDIAVMFSYAASHDTENSADIADDWDYSGEVEGVSDYYLVYTIRETDMQTTSAASTAAAAFTTWYNGLTDAQKKLPIFIMSHRPMHERREGCDGGAEWYNVISAAAKTSDIVFFWAHNHTGETSVDTDAYYVEKNGTEYVKITNGDSVIPNFTYMNAGYINANNQDPERINVATTVQITADSLIFQDYTTSGEYTNSTYSHNVTVAREFAGTTDSGDGEGGSTDETTDPTEETTAPTEGEEEGGTTTETKEVYVLVDTMTVGEDYLIANGNSGSVTLLGQSSGSATTTTAEVKTSGDYTYIETADADYVWNATAHTNSSYSTYPRLINAETYAMYASSGSLAFSDSLTSTSGAVYTRYWTYSDGQLACVSTNSGSTTYYLTYSDGYSMTSTATDGIYIYEKQTITVSSDGTVSGGGSTEGGTDEDDTTTGGSTETVVGDGTYTTADDGSWQKVTFKTTTTGTETKTVYVLSSSDPSGNVLIADSNTAGDVHLVANDGGDLSNVTTTVIYGDCDGDGDSEYYIELTDAQATNSLWTVSNSYRFANQEEYLRCSNGSLSVSSQSTTWSYSSNRLSYRSSGGSGGPGGSSSTYYLRYNSGWTVTTSSSSATSIYFYIPTEVEVDTTVETTKTYSVSASDIEYFYTADETDTETVTITKSVTDGTPGGTYTYEIVEGGDDIITSISEDGVITFNGAEGTAQVKVSYSWTEGEGDEAVTYTIWQVIDVTATSPYYTIDLHKANVTYVEATGLTEFAEGTIYYTKNEDGTYTQVSGDAEFDSSVTYYTLSYTLGDEITAPIAIKGIEEGDRYGVWAVVKYYDGTTADGTDMGAVGDAIEWSSSDETIATVDKNTGIITFTGKEGTVQITATYLNGNKPSDTITISATASQYSVPSDGTSDFPEYPDEGAIRFDKTATAVGNFSETGIAMVELSMTGVPYSSGSEIDVVVMLDMSTSMDDDRIAATVAATKVFVESIVKNTDGTYNSNRIYVGYFNGDTVYTITDSGNIGGELATVDNDTEYNALIAAIEDEYDGALTDSGTNYDVSLEECYNVLTAAKTDGTGNNRDQFVLFMSDGGPTDYATSASNVVAESTVVTWFDVTDSDSANWTNSMVEEYWSGLMKDNGVTIYSVGLILQEQPTSGPQDYRDYSADQNYYVTSTLLTGIASGADYFINCESATDTADMEEIFADIAVKILQAATDVTVEDQITDKYTMIFDIPTDTNYNHTISTNQEFYIEFLKYTLDENHERVDSDSDGDTYDDATSVTKLYLGVSNGTYYAASDASGTAYAAPVFAQSVIGEKGTLYYWTIDENYASKAAVTYTNSDDTYYFIPYGMEANEDGTAPDGWYNMTSGAYAYGTIDEVTNTSTNLVIATPYFVYNASTKMLYWTVDKLDTAEYALRYFLYLDDSATDVGETTEVDAATYPTNDHAYITYTNFRGNDCQQKFPVPQLTWNGAQVSYVFYLVNSAGQPINKSGQVVDFANAVFVTDVYTKEVVWNKGVDGSTGTGELSADWLADELLPDEYTIYDELAGFTLNVYEKADGTTIKNQFTIEGDTAANISSSLNTRLDLETTESTVSVVTTKVYNTKAGQKVTGYKTYYSTDTDMAGIDFSNVTVAFAVVWESKLVEDVVVVDYGLDVIINVVQNDLLQNTVSGIGVGNSAYGNTAMNTGVIATSQLGTAALTIDGNTISIENENAIRFHQGDMEFTAPVKFYYESPVKFYEDSEQKTGFMYSSVTVIPATTIYYEDSFLDLTSFTKGEDGTFTEDATSKWTTDGTVVNATQDQDRPGASKIAAALDADNNYGYDSAYETMSTHSLNNAAHIIVDADTRGEATFTFYGTGFDVISMTSNTTGTLTVQVYSGVEATGTAVKTSIVDTYYGMNADGSISVNDPAAIYQVPVMKIFGLTYGQYTVKITAAYNEFFDHGTGGSYDLYLDAIRIYDPTGNLNTEANNAYVADGEGWPQYIELRNNIIAAEGVTIDDDGNVTFPEDTTMSGAIFIDSNDATTSIVDYVSYGPNNELYLAPGQSVSFALDQTYASIIADVQIAMKLGNGSSVTYEIYNAASDGTKSNTITGTLETATDLYYSIKDLASGTIVISNTSGGILSITNIKVTYTQNPYGTSTSSEDDLDSGIMTTSLYVDEEVATAAVMSLRSMPVYEPEETVPEETEPETTVPEETEPETTVPEETEPEETVPEETEPETTVPEEDTSEEVTVEKVVETVKKIVKKLFGWLFG